MHQRRTPGATPATRIEILTPDFRRRMDIALERLGEAPPDVFNHNLETTPALYRKARPGADYHWSLDLIRRFKAQHPHIPTKSGLMLGLGEEIEDVKQVLRDLREHDCDMLTLGQYLQPSRYHLKVERFVDSVRIRRPWRIRKSTGVHQRGQRSHGAVIVPRRPAGRRGLRIVIPVQAGIQSYKGSPSGRHSVLLDAGSSPA